MMIMQGVPQWDFHNEIKSIKADSDGESNGGNLKLIGVELRELKSKNRKMSELFEKD